MFLRRTPLLSVHNFPSHSIRSLLLPSFAKPTFFLTLPSTSHFCKLHLKYFSSSNDLSPDTFQQLADKTLDELAERLEELEQYDIPGLDVVLGVTCD
jgi:hypothetical protein